MDDVVGDEGGDGVSTTLSRSNVTASLNTGVVVAEVTSSRERPTIRV